jgi:hypothetical protein
MTVARYNFPAAVGISVISPTHLVLMTVAVKSRRSRSGKGALVLSCRVNPLRRLTFRATRPCRRIESATVFSLTFQPFSRRSTNNLGDPCRPRRATNSFATAASTLARRRADLVGCRLDHL